MAFCEYRTSVLAISCLERLGNDMVGDVGLAMSLAVIFLTFKSLDYNIVFSLVPCVKNMNFSFLSLDFDRLSVISFFIF